MIPIKENGLSPDTTSPNDNWEVGYEPNARRYFYIDHNSRTTTWINPIDKQTKPTNPSECFDDQLPYGWERLMDQHVGVYYANHLEKRNQWPNPVDEWRARMSDQHHYSNSQHLSIMEQSGNSFDSNNQTTSQTTADTKPDTSLQASDIDEKFLTSLPYSNTPSTDIVNTIKSSHSTQGSKYEDSDLLDMMDNHFGRKSSQSVEV